MTFDKVFKNKTSKHSNTQTSKQSDAQMSEESTQASKEKDVQTSEHSNVQASKAKSKNDEYIRTTLYLPRKTHQRLKMASISEQQDMSEIVTRLLEEWLEHSDI